MERRAQQRPAHRALAVPACIDMQGCAQYEENESRQSRRVSTNRRFLRHTRVGLRWRHACERPMCSTEKPSND